MPKLTPRIIICFMFMTATIFAKDFSFNGQLSVWTDLYSTGLHDSQFGIRYMPDLKFSQALNKDVSIYEEISLNVFAATNFGSFSDIVKNGQINPYRMILRCSTSQFEARAGLQKINFGSATILRPLMWFDKIDPRDPLQITNGVYGLMAKYDFLDNKNVWFWALYGNNNLKGLETVKTAENTVELGGRFQFPIPMSEIALSFHTRKLDATDWNAKHNTILSDGREYRYGLDGKFDVGVGLWFEGVVQQTVINEMETDWHGLLTLGMDYTFKIGNGLYVLGEHLTGTSKNISALDFRYGIGLIDSINAISYYDWTSHKFTWFLAWKRTYDDIVLNISGFWSEKNIGGAFSGKGVQIMLTYNH